MYPEFIPEVTEVEMFGSDNQVVTIDQGGRAIALPVVPMFVDEDGQTDTGNLAYNKFNEVVYN
jgi:hypothetical protein